MSMGSGADTVVPDTYASERYAKIADKQWSRYQSTYAPWQDKLIDDVTNPANTQTTVGQAMATSGNAYDRAIAARNRTIQSYGMQLNPAQIEAMKRKDALGRTMATVTGGTTTRRAVTDRNNTVTQQLVNQGQGLSGMAISGLNNANQIALRRAQIEQAKENAANANDAAEYDALMQLGGTGLGLGTAALILS